MKVQWVRVHDLQALLVHWVHLGRRSVTALKVLHDVHLLTEDVLTGWKAERVDRIETCLCQLLFVEDVVVALHNILEGHSRRNATVNDSRNRKTMTTTIERTRQEASPEDAKQSRHSEQSRHP